MKTPRVDCSRPSRNSNQVPPGCTREGTPENCGGEWQVSPAHVRSAMFPVWRHDGPSCWEMLTRHWELRRELDAWRPLAPCDILPQSKVSQAVSRRLPTPVTQVRFQVMWDLWCTKWHRAGYLRILRSSPANSRSADFCTLICHQKLAQWAHKVNSSLTSSRAS
jgi:hypothetical protein